MSNISNQQCAVALTIGFLNVVTTCFGGGISFQGLGDLPGGAFSSGARGVSLDGSTVVGQARTDTRYEAFSWRADTGMVGLGGGN